MTNDDDTGTDAGTTDDSTEENQQRTDAYGRSPEDEKYGWRRCGDCEAMTNPVAPVFDSEGNTRHEPDCAVVEIADREVTFLPDDPLDYTAKETAVDHQVRRQEEE
jgi:hypothetical protein